MAFYRIVFIAHQFRKSPASQHHLTVPPRYRLNSEHVRSPVLLRGSSWNSLLDRLRDPTLSFRKLFYTELFASYKTY